MPCVLNVRCFIAILISCQPALRPYFPSVLIKTFLFSKPDQLDEKYWGLSPLQAVSNLLWSNIRRYIQSCRAFGAADSLACIIMCAIDQYR